MFKLFKAKPPGWLADYPVYSAPHAGLPWNLTNQQAESNLQYLLDNKSARIESLGQRLNSFGIDLTAGLSNDDPQPLVNALHQWSAEHWKALHNKKTANDAHWLGSNRNGDDLIYSVIMDTAIVLGELIIKHRPSYAWATDLNPVNIKDKMHSARRCVVQAPSIAFPDDFVLTDIEQLVVERFHKPDNIRQQTDNTWWRAIDNCVSGAHEGSQLV